MFRIKEMRQPLPQTVADEAVADGFVHVCDQTALMFGSDRKIPAKARPVVSIKRDGLRVIVLPCTTRDNSESADFFELVNNRHVLWTKAGDGRRTFACCRYETVDSRNLWNKIGIMPQPARIAVLQWLKSRY